LPSGVVAPGEPDELAVFERFCFGLTLDDKTRFRLEPFQCVMLRDYFDGVVETLILLPKKNGKTTLLAALALFHLTSTPDAECVIGASSRDQATILYEQAIGFVTRSPFLQERVQVQSGYRRIRSRKLGGRVRVLAADVDTADGIIPTLALVDELHRHKSAGLYGVFRDGLGPLDGQMLTISTAGDHEQSPLGQMRATARKLPGVERDGKHLHVRTDDGAFAMHEWALDRDDDLNDLALVKLVNPLAAQTIEKLAQRHSSPSMLPATWARFACGVWMMRRVVVDQARRLGRRRAARASRTRRHASRSASTARATPTRPRSSPVVSKTACLQARGLGSAEGRTRLGSPERRGRRGARSNDGDVPRRSRLLRPSALAERDRRVGARVRRHARNALPDEPRALHVVCRALPH
jgi:hypothetical protein